MRMIKAIGVALCLAVTPAMALDNGDVNEMLDAALSLKRDQRFDEARHELEMIIRLDHPGAEGSTDRARDELRYGLPLQEARYHIIRLGEPLGTRTERMQGLQRAQALLRGIIDDNADRPERAHEAQAMLDQLAISAQAMEVAFRNSAVAALQPLRIELDMAYRDRGEAPAPREVARLLARVLTDARLAPDHYIIKDYWRSRDGYYLILRDTAGGGPDVKIRNENGRSAMSNVPRAGRE